MSSDLISRELSAPFSDPVRRGCDTLERSSSLGRRLGSDESVHGALSSDKIQSDEMRRVIWTLPYVICHSLRLSLASVFHFLFPVESACCMMLTITDDRQYGQPIISRMAAAGQQGSFIVCLVPTRTDFGTRYLSNGVTYGDAAITRIRLRIFSARRSLSI